MGGLRRPAHRQLHADDAASATGRTARSAPTFTAPVTKYADNGLVTTHAEMDSYLREYRRRSWRDYAEYEAARRWSLAIKRIARESRARVPEGSALHRAGQKLYAWARK